MSTPSLARRRARAPAPSARARGLRLGGRLDRYVLGLFGSSYAVAFLLVVGLFLILDLATKLDEYVRPGDDGSPPASGWLVVEFYMLNLPFLYLQLAPFVTLLAGLFSLAKLLRHNEVVAALAAGVSNHRVLLPLFVSATLLALGMFGLREWFTERIGMRRDALENRLLERDAFPVYEGLWLKDRAGNPVRLGRYRQTAPPTVQGLEATVFTADRWINIEAAQAYWMRERGTWKLAGGLREELDDRGRAPERLEVLEGIDFTPRDVAMALKARERPLDLSFSEVRMLAARDPDNVQYQTLLQYHLTFPLANVVLLLVGLPLLMRHDRARVEGVVGGFILCVFYFGADFIARSMGMQGVLSPLVASWLPVLFFGSLGVVLFGSMRS